MIRVYGCISTKKPLPFCESQPNFLILPTIQALLDGCSGLLRDPGFWAHINQKPLPFSESQLYFLIFPAIQALLDGCKIKKPSALHRAFWLRSRADSNRCTRFCRPLPSRSATKPLGVQIYQKKLFFNDDCDIVHISIYWRSNFSHLHT